MWVLQSGVFALDVTLYRVEAPQPVGNFATTVSAGTVLGALPVGVANDGATVYVVTEVQSLMVYWNTQTTQTVLSTPTTITCELLFLIISPSNPQVIPDNFKADSTKVEQDIAVTFFGVVGVGRASCLLHKDGGGQCGAGIIADLAGANNPITVLSTRYTGKAQAFFTLNNVQTESVFPGRMEFLRPVPNEPDNVSGHDFVWFFFQALGNVVFYVDFLRVMLPVLMHRVESLELTHGRFELTIERRYSDVVLSQNPSFSSKDGA